MDRNQAIRLQQARADYLELAANIVPSTGEAELTVEEIIRRYQEVCRIAAAYVPHIGHGEQYDRSRMSALIPIAEVPGLLPQLGMRYKYTYSHIGDGASNNLFPPNEFDEIIERITVHWLHFPNNENVNPHPFIEEIPVSGALLHGEVFAEEEMSSSQLLRWIGEIEDGQRDANLRALGIEWETTERDFSEAENTAARLILIESSMQQFEAVFNSLNQ